ncbi:MAG: DUF4340 domain-containing protein [bacterium]|nr:DUF4340 domain-containing protein [bacterium]
MNRNRPLLILAAVVALLLVASVAQRVLHRRAVTSPATATVVAADFDPAGINRVTVGAGADTATVVIERLGEGWVTRTAWDHPADPRKLQELLAALDSLQGDFRSDEAAILDDYGLGPQSAPVKVTLFGKDWQPVCALLLGKRADDGAGVFVRAPGSNAVYLARTEVRGKLGLWSPEAAPESRHFLDLSVFKTDAAGIRRITLHQGDKALVMEKVLTAAGPGDGSAPPPQEWEWTLTSPSRRALAKTKVDGVMNALASIQAADIADPRVGMEQYGLWKAERRVEVALADGSTFELRVGDARPVAGGVQEGRFCMTSRDRKIWVIREFKIDQIFKKLEDLLPDA